MPGATALATSGSRDLGDLAEHRRGLLNEAADAAGDPLEAAEKLFALQFVLEFVLMERAFAVQ